jgi:hypothetical protein
MQNLIDPGTTLNARDTKCRAEFAHWRGCQSAAFHQRHLWVSDAAIARRDLGHTREYVSLETMGAIERYQLSGERPQY